MSVFYYYERGIWGFVFLKLRHTSLDYKIMDFMIFCFKKTSAFFALVGLFDFLCVKYCATFIFFYFDVIFIVDSG